MPKSKEIEMRSKEESKIRRINKSRSINLKMMRKKARIKKMCLRYNQTLLTTITINLMIKET